MTSAAAATPAAAAPSHTFSYSSEAAEVTCGLSKSLDSITLAGMAGNDTLTIEAFPGLSTPVLLGGEGNDTLTAGNGTEDMLVDGNGSGEDILRSNN